MTRVLAVDAGRTSCRLAVFEGTRRAATTTVGATHTLVDQAGAERVRDTIVAAAQRLDADVGTCTHLVAGLAGVSHDPEIAAACARLLGGALPIQEIAVTSDVAIAHAGALDRSPGVVLIAGSGAIALGVGRDGTAGRVDGWGYLFGDAGSGYWIGRAGLEHALRAWDGRGRPTELVQRAARRHGDLARLHATIVADGASPRTVAAFAPEVLEAADAGDTVAYGVVDAAALELAGTVAAAAEAVMASDDEVPVAAVGGLLGSAGLVADRFASALAATLPRAVLRPARGDALAGAAAIASDGGPLEPLVQRWRRPR